MLSRGTRKRGRVDGGGGKLLEGVLEDWRNQDESPAQAATVTTVTPSARTRIHTYTHTKARLSCSKQKRNQKRWVHRCTGGIRLVGESGRRKARAGEVARQGLPQTKRVSDEMHKAQAAGEHNLEVREDR